MLILMVLSDYSGSSGGDGGVISRGGGGGGAVVVAVVVVAAVANCSFVTELRIESPSFRPCPFAPLARVPMTPCRRCVSREVVAPHVVLCPR